jgi:hypothetical protein
MLTVRDIEIALDFSVIGWEDCCYGIAQGCVNHKLVEGTAVYGHYTGFVHQKSSYYKKPIIRHGWVILDDGRIFDPTRWCFENKKPYLYYGVNNNDYDEGGQTVRTHNRPIPEFNFEDKKILIDFGDAERCILDLLQLYEAPPFWTEPLVFYVANAHYDLMGDYAVSIYNALKDAGLIAFIPIDNQRRAEREGYL